MPRARPDQTVVRVDPLEPDALVSERGTHLRREVGDLEGVEGVGTDRLGRHGGLSARRIEIDIGIIYANISTRNPGEVDRSALCALGLEQPLLSTYSGPRAWVGLLVALIAAIAHLAMLLSA